MCRPLKDIITELEAKYKGLLLSDLEERRRVIVGFDNDVDYLFRCFNIFEEHVKFVLEHKLDIEIIKRSALNLVFIMEHLCDSILIYRNYIELYLLDDRYDKNQSLHRRFAESHEKMKSLFDRLIENDVFNEGLTNRSDVINRFLINEEPDESQIAIVVTTIKINKEETTKMNTSELLVCLDYQFVIFQTNLLILTVLLIEDEDSFEDLYNLNYLLYAKYYWPSRVNNFRAHVMHQRFKNKVDINGLEALRIEAIREFEYNTTAGKIWRDNSEDFSQLAIEIKKSKLNEEQWKYFFQAIFELEEFDRWIEELRNPPESDEDKQKRERLLKSNKVFCLQPAKSKKNVDILLLYQFIETRFIAEKMFVYDWFALFYILKRTGVITTCTVEDFTKQMNDDEWFANAKKKCKANEINTYRFLLEKSPDVWDVKFKDLGNRATKKSIDNLSRKYSELEDTIDEIYVKE